MLCLLGFIVFSLVMTLRRRWLALWELLIHIAGTGLTIAIPRCFRVKYDHFADVVVVYHEADLGC